MFESIERAMDREPEADGIQNELDAMPFMKEYRNKIGLIGLSLLLAFVGLCVFYVLTKRIKPPELFFLGPKEEITSMIGMELPNQSRDAVKDWAREAVQKAYTFDFLNGEKELAAAEPYFTIDAWPKFKSSMSGSDLLRQVQKDKLSVSVVAQTAPIIYDSARDNGSEFAWKVLIPVTISFSGDAVTKTDNLLVRVTVVRVPTTENPKGLGVLQMQSGPLPYSAGKAWANKVWVNK